MEKIYGYKTDDVKLLAEFLKTRGNGSLTKAFSEFGAKFGKAKGTVRNLYYALAKKSVEDNEFCQKYLDGEPIKVSKIVEFNEKEERELIRKVLLDKASGKSVRSSIMDIANGNAKVALRYQNKYRNALKNKPELFNSVVKELSDSGYNVSDLDGFNAPYKHCQNDAQINKLKQEIDGLVGKIALNFQKENKALKERVCSLEKENLKLLKIIYGYSDGAIKPPFFTGGQPDVIS